MVIGQLKGGAMVHGDMKFINGTTFPDWWYRHNLHSFFLFPLFYYCFFYLYRRTVGLKRRIDEEEAVVKSPPSIFVSVRGCCGHCTALHCTAL